EVHVTGLDLDGNEVSLEADELLARLIQHELDHLDGVLLLDHLEADERRAALRILRERYVDSALPGVGVQGGTGPSGRPPASGGLRLP
ncbi:MAG: peptide deformylase, partial [Acidimicrobiia bacterium]|nr:peptide deformylase [Acidimicrobiia bacterium]